MQIDLDQLEASLNTDKPTTPVALRRPAVVPQEAKPTHTLRLTEEREKSHGDYANTARIAQSLKRIVWHQEGWVRMSEIQRESAEMICTKLARVLSGNPNIKDHWDDIAGYAKLCSDRIVEP